MHIHRINAITLRHLKQLPQDMNQWVSLMFWPFFNIILFGITGFWLKDGGNQYEFFALVAGVAFWQLVVRVNFGISIGFLQEIFSRNITNLFSSPLTPQEWMVAIALYSFCMGLFTMLFCVAIVWLLFGINILSLGLFAWYTFLQLFIAGTSFGFICTSLLMLWGTRAHMLIFVIGVAPAPISGAFYPVTTLPLTIQKIAYALPFAHIFYGLQTYIQSGVWSLPASLYTSALNLILLGIGYISFVKSFYISKRSGFQHTEE